MLVVIPADGGERRVVGSRQWFAGRGAHWPSRDRIAVVGSDPQGDRGPGRADAHGQTSGAVTRGLQVAAKRPNERREDRGRVRIEFAARG
jgi:hypothetical protein